MLRWAIIPENPLHKNFTNAKTQIPSRANIIYVYCNAAVFEAYVEHILLPELKPGQVVVIDNARFHQSFITRQLIENAGCILKFLPPYSPDLSPIEHRWSPIKQATRKILRNFTDILAAMHTVLITSPIKC